MAAYNPIDKRLDQTRQPNAQFGPMPNSAAMPPEPPAMTQLPVVQEEPIQHDDNLAEFMEDDELMEIAKTCYEFYCTHKSSRQEWERAYIKGLDLLGLKVEERTEPWDGACGVYHPLLTEAVIRFQAHAITSMCPAAGPARTRIVGVETDELWARAKRVQEELNYVITEDMVEYRPEMEQMLLYLPIAGSTFTKTWFDPLLKRPIMRFVPAENMVVPYGASDLRSTDFCHVIPMPKNQLKKLQKARFYLDIDLGAAPKEYTDIREKYDELTGEEDLATDSDHCILEFHMDYELSGFETEYEGVGLPYVITVDHGSGKVLSIRKNWDEKEGPNNRREYFTHWMFMPGLGFYGLGLAHLLGGIADAASSTLRQLIDSGTLSNIPAGLKDKRIRIENENAPFMPGEWRDADIFAGTLREGLFPLPYKEPSPVLFQLMQDLVAEGRRLGSVADSQVANLSQQAPVGSVLAVLERALKVMSAVQARLHYSQKHDLQLISDIIVRYMPPQYKYNTGGFLRIEDFGPPVDVIPVSDPNAATVSQKIVQLQAAIQMAQAAPHVYDMAKLHRQALEALDIKNPEQIVKLQGEIPPTDAVTENMNVIMQRPVKAYPHQDHEAHITIHMNALKDPKIAALVGQSPQAQNLQAAMESHIAEHLAYQYRREIEDRLGVQLKENMPPEMENAVASAVARASEKLLQDDVAEMKRKQAEEIEQDPVYQLQKRQLDIKEGELTHKQVIDAAKIRLEAAKVVLQNDMEERRLGQEIVETGLEQAVKLKDVQSRRASERDRIAADKRKRDSGGGKS